MARTIREATLNTRTARLRLEVKTSRHWRALDQGLHLGYRRLRTNGSWFARRRNDLGQYRETKLGRADDYSDTDGTSILDFSEAQRAAREWSGKEARREAGLGVERLGPYRVSQAMADYLEDYRRRGGKAVRAIKSAIEAHLSPALGGTEVSKLTSRRLQDWHRQLAEQPRRVRTRKGAKQNVVPLDTTNADAVRRRRATANRILTYLKAALNHAWREGMVASDDAWRRVKPFRSVDAPVNRYLKLDEITRLLNACEGEFRNLVHGALLTGCRYGELARLLVGDFNPQAGTVTIRLSKSGQSRHVTLTEEGLDLIGALAVGRPAGNLLFPKDDGTAWGASHQKRPLEAACKRAGIIPAINFHILRHTHASHLAMSGAPMAVIARQLGHADTRMTERHYAHLAPNYVADTIRASLPRLSERTERSVVPLRPEPSKLATSAITSL